MTQQRTHEYTYPFNAWITQVLPLRDFVEAFVASTRKLKQSNPEKWSENRKLQYNMLMEMVYTFELPRDVADQVWQPFAEEARLEEAAAARAQAAALRTKAETRQLELETVTYGESEEETQRRHAPLKPPQSRIAQQIQEQKEKAAKRDAIATGQYQTPRHNPEPQQKPLELEPKVQQSYQQQTQQQAQPQHYQQSQSHQQPVKTAPSQAQPKAAPAIKAPVNRAGAQDVATKIAQAKSNKTAENIKKALYAPGGDQEPAFSSFTSVEQEPQQYSYAEPQTYNEPRKATIKSRTRYQTPMPVAKPKSRAGLFIAILLLVAVNILLIATFVIPQFKISDIIKKLAGQQPHVIESRDAAELSAPVSYNTDQSLGVSEPENALNSETDSYNHSAYAEEERVLIRTDNQAPQASSVSDERAALLKQMETTGSNNAQTQPAAPAYTAPQQPAEQQYQASQNQAVQSQRQPEAVRNAYSNLLSQAGDLNLEPASEPDTALYYLQEMVAAGATSNEIANAHAALDRGFTAMSKLARASGESVESQRLMNQAINHENLTNSYRNQ